jgi:hypothetical protein
MNIATCIVYAISALSIVGNWLIVSHIHYMTDKHF